MSQATAADIAGSRQGIALLGQVQASYRRVPGVVLTGETDSQTVRVIMRLRAGVVAAEEWVVENPSGTTRLQIERGGPTYWNAPQSKCWRSVSRSSSLSLSADVGARFPLPKGVRTVRVRTPLRQGGSSILSLRIEEDNSRSECIRVVIDSRTKRIRQLVFPGVGLAHASALGSAPRLAAGLPHCTS